MKKARTFGEFINRHAYEEVKVKFRPDLKGEKREDLKGQIAHFSNMGLIITQEKNHRFFPNKGMIEEIIFKRK